MKILILVNDFEKVLMIKQDPRDDSEIISMKQSRIVKIGDPSL
jgi:hypothetical protein